LSVQLSDRFVDDGVDALSLLTPLLEKRRQIVVISILIALATGGIAALQARKYRAELSLTPVVNSKGTTGLGGIAALAGATLNTGYQLTPARMVELLKSRTVLAGVGMSTLPGGKERVIDRFLGERYTRGDQEEIQKHLERIITVTTNKETGTIDVSVEHRDSALARIIASRIVDSASQIFVRTSKAQAQQLRIAQEGRVEQARSQLAAAEERLRQFRFSNRATPAFSAASVDLQRLDRDIQLAEQVYTQAITDQQSAYARELEATPTVVIQDQIAPSLPKVRKRVIVKTVIAGIVSFVLMCVAVLLIDLTKRRLARPDSESERFRTAVASLPRLRRGAPQA
jgi:uncharacterized protein involved in exopolysaccharide biosynthesis